LLLYFGMGMPKSKTYSVTVWYVTRGLLSVGEKQPSFYPLREVLLF